MTAASELWAAVKTRYDSDGLVTLTNIRNRSATAIDDTVGTAAAQTVVDLWPLYAQTAYDSTNGAHVEVGCFGVVAVLWRRGGSSSQIEQVKWDEVFGDDGLIARVRRTEPRARGIPVSNSGVQQSSELVGGRPRRGWADPANLPANTLPSSRPADYEG